MLSTRRSVPARCQKRGDMPDFIEPETGLPDLFSRWFESRGWTPRPHQLALIELAQQGKSALLIAPTGAGKTLAGFLPSLIELTERRRNGQDLAHKKRQGAQHTLYISPLKALATQ